MKKLLHIVLLLLAMRAGAQQPVFRHITEDDGLPDNEIYYLYQDKKGIIWISTNSGLCRYNGQSFQYYSNPKLTAKSTGCIQEDLYGRLWVNNFSGQIFYVQDDSLVIVNLPGVSSCVGPFTIGPQNQLVVTSEKNKIVILKPRHTKRTEIPEYSIDTELQTEAQNPSFSADGKLWTIISEKRKDQQRAVAAYASGQNAFFPVDIGNNKPVQQSGFVFEQEGTTYYYEREKSSLYHLSGDKFTAEQKFDLPGFKLVAPLQNGRLAFCTNSGFYIADAKQQAVVTKLFPGQTISAFCEDHKGNLWAGTLSEGIYFIPKRGLTQEMDGPGNNYQDLTTLCAGPGNKLLMGFLNGELGVLEPGAGYKLLQPANKLSTKVQSVFYSNEMQMLNWQSDNIYQSHFSATDNRLSPYRGVGYATKDMVYIPKWKGALLANPVDIQLISLDAEPILSRIDREWIAGHDTATVFDRTMIWPQQAVLLSKERGRAVYFDDRTETAWGADKNGITLYRKNEKSNIRLNGEPIYATSFCNHQGIVWTGTFSQGLIAIKDEKPEKQFTVKDGLASNTIYKIISSKDHLWLNTDKGLQYFDIAKNAFYLIDKTLGLPTYKINGIALANNTVYISTPKGLFSIADTIQFDWDRDQQVYLQSIYCNQQVVGSKQTAFKTDENSFLFKVETPVYNNRALLRYRYRLKGADKEFYVTGLDNAVFEYKSLRSGDYEFELTLTDTKGNIIGKPVSYAFKIAPPFYQTIWFIALCVLVLAALIYLLVRQRIGKIKKREREKLELARLESDLKQSQLSGIKAQMNPHFMFNALNSIQEFILLNDKKQANMYMGKFADLMRMTLDMSNKKEVLLEEEIKVLQLYLELEALRFEDGFIYTLKTDDAVDKENIHLPAMLIQPNIENAVKHGLLHKTGEKRLDIHFSIQNGHTLCCTVTDNGIGRKRSGEINMQRLRKHTSFATGATQKRLELLNHDRKQPIEVIYEDLHDEHGNASGTRVTINIPL